MTQRVSLVALLVGILPILAINTNYLIAASEGYVPWCVPYWDSCTSISATGREGFSFFFFKATMIPMAFLYMWYWVLTKKNLIRFGYRGSAIPSLGIVASLALLCYAVVLGMVGDGFQLTRRIGIIFFFGFTYLSQLLVLNRTTALKIPDPSRRWQLWLCVVILFLGILTLFLDILLDNYDDYEDAFEWVLSLLLHCNFVISYWGWRALATNGYDAKS